MNSKETFITPSFINNMLSEGQNVSIGDDFVISRQQNMKHFSAFQYPFRINCFMAVFCFKGNISCNLNMRDYTLTDGMLMLITPGNIVRITSPDLQQALSNARFTFVAVSSSYISNVDIDFNAFYNEALALMKTPCIKVTDDELHLLTRYIDLIYSISDHTAKYLRECVGSVISSIFYQFASFVDNYMQTDNTVTPTDSSRRRRMFEAFMILAKDNHQNQRMMSFYADKLCVTPKYLSKIVKEVSGRSAPEWINGFVIMSAKSMLKYTGMTIKEIALELNFPNQSFFSKFFKTQTGLTPNEYRLE